MLDKKLSRKETSFFLKPWLNTKGIRTSIKTRNILLGKSKRLKTEEANQAYKKYDKILNKVKQRSYNNHISKEISDNLENKRKLWKIFDKISNRKKKSKTKAFISCWEINIKLSRNSKYSERSFQQNWQKNGE